MTHDRSNNRTRPELEWRKVAVFTGPEPVVDEKKPEHVKAKARRRAAVLVEAASAGFDYKLQVDRVKVSYTMGWEDNGEFFPVKHIPDDRVKEFIEALTKASSESMVAHTNAVKATRGQLTTTMERQLKKAAGNAP